MSPFLFLVLARAETRVPGANLESDWDQLQLSHKTVAVDEGNVIDKHYTWLSICNCSYNNNNNNNYNNNNNNNNYIYNK